MCIYINLAIRNKNLKNKEKNHHDADALTFFLLTSRLAPGRTRRRPFAPTAAVFRLRDSESLALLRAFFLKMAANCGRRSWYSSRILFPKKMKRLDGSAKCFASYKFCVFLCCSGWGVIRVGELSTSTWKQSVYQCCGGSGSAVPYIGETDPDLAIFLSDLQDDNKIFFVSKFFCFFTFDAIFPFFYFCLMIDGYGSGKVPRINGSGSRRPKNIRIPRIRIRNTGVYSTRATHYKVVSVS